MASFEGKVIAITGSASGMGQRIAIILSERGAILALADQNATGLTTTMEEIAKAKASGAEGRGKGHTTTVLDVRDTAAVEAWIRGIVEKLGRLDGAVNFAGVVPESRGERIPIREGREDLWDLTVGVNAKGVWNCLRAELAVMERGASIVNASSNLGLIGSPGLAAYAASKHAVVGITRCAALEEGERGIRINCVCPGVIQTPMVAAENIPFIVQKTPLGRPGQAIEVANLAIFLLSDDASFITGSAYSVDGGWVAG